LVGIVEIVNAVLTGLVSITAGCDALHPIYAVIIGCVSTLIYVAAEKFVRERLWIDDPLSA
jgi:Amt family ammonium transporter